MLLIEFKWVKLIKIILLIFISLRLPPKKFLLYNKTVLLDKEVR